MGLAAAEAPASALRAEPVRPDDEESEAGDAPRALTSVERSAPAPRTSVRDRVLALNQRALGAYARLDPANALHLLSFALRLCQSAGRDEVALTARTQTNLGVVLAGGFKQRGLAARHFRMARALDPSILPTRDLSNPEIEAALREAGAYARRGL
jgi:hypothetical protein